MQEPDDLTQSQGSLPDQLARRSEGPMERIQLGVRIEKRMAKVLKATAEYLDRSLGELLETIVLHAFEGSRPFTEKTLAAIAELKKVYGMEYGLNAIDRVVERGIPWKRFTEPARRVVFFAQEEAVRLGESYIGTQHLLLGLVREPEARAGRILGRIGISSKKVRSEILRMVTRTSGELPREMWMTVPAQRAIDLAFEEARRLDRDTIDTEHLLLGLLRDQEEQAQAAKRGLTFGQGVLEVLPEGWGFLRGDPSLDAGPSDIYVSQAQIQRFGLKTGDRISGQVRPPGEGEKYYGLAQIDAVNPTDRDADVRPDSADWGGTVLAKLGATLERARREVQAMQAEGGSG
jgi:Rho termination factor, RNA-binding domain/Clp amino terminal domain, pathogenicity island component